MGLLFGITGGLAFEMITGNPPFNDANAMGIYKQIMNNRFAYPAELRGRAKEIIGKLLVTNPHKRLGGGKLGGSEVIDDDFFGAYDFNALEKKQYALSHPTSQPAPIPIPSLPYSPPHTPPPLLPTPTPTPTPIHRYAAPWKPHLEDDRDTTYFEPPGPEADMVEDFPDALAVRTAHTRTHTTPLNPSPSPSPPPSPPLPLYCTGAKPL